MIAVITFYIGHTRAKKSEEIRISRDHVDAQEYTIEKWTVMEDRNPETNMEMISAIDSLTNELDYFVYLMEKGEIMTLLLENTIENDYFLSFKLPNL